MATVGRDLKSVELTARELWQDGPPHELFKELRSGCPIHWTESFEELPEERCTGDEVCHKGAKGHEIG